MRTVMFCGVTILAFFGSMLSAFADSRVLLVTNHWPPYVYDEKPSVNQGFFTELVISMCRRQGIEVDIQYVPWLRAENMVKHGLAFAAYPYAITESRLRYADFSDAITRSANPPRVFYHLPTSPETLPNDLNLLMQYRIGTYLGYFVKEKFDELGVDYVLAETEQKAFEMLQKGRMDFLPTDPESGWKIIRHRFPDQVSQFAVLDTPFPGTSLHLMVSRQYPNASEIRQKCNMGLAQMMEDGSYHQLLKSQNKEEYAVTQSVD